MCLLMSFAYFFFFNDTATTEIYTLSLHDALPILADVGDPAPEARGGHAAPQRLLGDPQEVADVVGDLPRSEEHTSELQSRLHLVCRLLLEKKKKQQTIIHSLTVLVNPHHPSPTTT